MLDHTPKGIYWRGKFLAYRYDDDNKLKQRDETLCLIVEGLGLSPLCKPGKEVYSILQLFSQAIWHMTRDYTLIWQPPVEHCDGLSDLMHAATGVDIGDDATARLVMAQTNEVREAELLRAGTGFHFVRASPSFVKYICEQCGWSISQESITDALTKVFDQYGEQPVHFE